MKTLVLRTISILLIVALAVALDGWLTYDFLDFRIDTPAKWLGVLLALILVAVIYWAEATKKSGQKNNRR